VDFQLIADAIAQKEIYIDDPAFYSKAFTFACQLRKAVYARDGDNFRRVSAEEYDGLSKRIDATQIQESCSVRNVLRTRRIANLLINDKGELNIAFIPRLIDHLKQHLYSLGPERQHDTKRQEHLLHVLTLLHESKELQRVLKNIDKPRSNKNAEQIIRDTLLLPANTVVTDAHTKRAVLSAWLCMLRQNVGSCFATAPAILVQKEQPEQFLKDISELFNTGRLKRTFGGVEYSVPLSISWGAGDLKRPFFLPLGEKFDNSDVWRSPGFEAAFTAVGLVDLDAPTEMRMQTVKALISAGIQTIEWNQPYMLISPEEILRKALLKNLDLTEKDIQDYESRPQGMIHTSLLMQPVAVSGGKGKGQQSALFLTQIEQAMTAFKGLANNALLKAWEFTLASFSETKAQFTRWNLYSSLGLGANEQGGIGACLYEVISRKLEQANRRVEEFQVEYETVYHQLKTMESRVRSVSSEKEASWLKAEYQSKRNEFYTLEEMRDKLHYKAQRLANLFDVLINQYYELFTRYFQEVYDADMQDVTTGPYDDSPAGFRLLYKYGRTNTSQWSLIKTPNQFVDALSSFFTAIEPELTTSDQFQGLQTELSEITTAVVSHVRTQEFLETAFHRMAAAHRVPAIKNPLDNLDRIDKKPWAYTSGGGMDTLVSCYYKLDHLPAIVSRWVENPTELLIFIIDTIKQIPPKVIGEFVQDHTKLMLMQSPTHAFLLKPGEKVFQCSWKNDVLTYTWVRDHLIAPRKKMLANMELNEQQMHHLVQKLKLKVPENYQHYFLKVFGNLFGSMSPLEFRNHIIQGIDRDRGLKPVRGSILNDDEVDGLLFHLLPLFPKSELRERLDHLYSSMATLSEERKERLLQILDVCQRFTLDPVIDAAMFQDIAKGLLCLASGETSSPIDYHTEITATAKKLGYALQAPIIFADTNWVKEEFGFVVNPGTGNLELWRCDPLGQTGYPMSSWEQWLDGSRKDITWGIYTKPYEYRFF